MKAVILASGLSKRMNDKKPKPLLRLLGIPIIEHTIRKLISRNYKVVVVYHREEIKEYLSKNFPEIEFVYNPEPERENGYSLYLVKNYVEDDFLLLMSDHYYGDEFFNKVKRYERTVLFVSKFVYDEEEATKVKVDGENIISIGKNLKDYDFFDTGFFYCKKEIFSYIERIVKDRYKITITDIMIELSKDKKIGYEIIEEIWFDIDTRKDLIFAEKFLEKRLIKKEDGIISRNINRKISIKLSKFLVRYNIFTPNVVTIISFILGIISSIMFLMNKYILAGILTQISSIIDGCDGEIARIKSMRSKFGAVLDSILDRYADSLIFFSAAISYGFSTITAIAIFLTLTATILISYTSHLTNLRPKIMSRDVRLFLVMLGSLLTVFNEILLLYTLIAIGIISHLDVFVSILRYKKLGSKY